MSSISLFSDETWTNKRVSNPQELEERTVWDIPHKTKAFSGADLSRCPCCGGGVVVILCYPASLVVSPPID